MWDGSTSQCTYHILKYQVEDSDVEEYSHLEDQVIEYLSQKNVA